MGNSLHNFFAVYLDDFNQAELLVHEFSAAENPTATAAVHEPKPTEKSRGNPAKNL